MQSLERESAQRRRRLEEGPSTYVQRRRLHDDEIVVTIPRAGDKHKKTDAVVKDPPPCFLRRQGVPGAEGGWV